MDRADTRERNRSIDPNPPGFFYFLALDVSQTIPDTIEGATCVVGATVGERNVKCKDFHAE
jgi:hypothetical protein